MQSDFVTRSQGLIAEQEPEQRREKDLEGVGVEKHEGDDVALGSDGFTSRLSLIKFLHQSPVHSLTVSIVQHHCDSATCFFIYIAVAKEHTGRLRP